MVNELSSPDRRVGDSMLWSCEARSGVQVRGVHGQLGDVGGGFIGAPMLRVVEWSRGESWRFPYTQKTVLRL